MSNDRSIEDWAKVIQDAETSAADGIPTTIDMAEVRSHGAVAMNFDRTEEATEFYVDLAKRGVL